MNLLEFVPRKSVLGLAVSAMALVAPIAAQAESWTFPVLSMDLRDSAATPFAGAPVDYVGLEASEVTKKWNLCLLVPHTTNDIIKAYLYGTVQEVKRLGASLTVLDAGGYGNLDKQLSQFDDCVTLGSDAILIMAVSPDAFNQKIAEARANGIKLIDLNIGINGPADGRVVVTFKAVGDLVGKALAAAHPAGSGAASAVVMPGPAGVAWSEDAQIGFGAAVEGSDVKVEKVIYGSPARLDQQPLVEDALTTYPDLKYIFGMGSSVEAAMSILREQGRVGEVQLYGSWLTPDMIAPIKSGEIAGVVVENATVVNQLAVDMAIRLLEGKATIVDAVPTVTLVGKDNVDAAATYSFAPADWAAEMSVD
jgi:protein TorT